MVLKLDFRKAFDSVCWDALDRVLALRGFGHTWRGWVSSLLSSGRTAVLLNGVPRPWIQCRQGLRQGDPLSPYLFIIVADLLWRMIIEPDNVEPLLHPLTDDLPCPIIQYAHDTLILVRAEEPQVCQLRQLLDDFASATGLDINYQKSTFVPVHVAPDHAESLAAILACPVSAFPQTYLGLALFDTKLPASVLDTLAVRVERCIPSWRVDLLNRGGRLTLVNSVLSAQVTYTAAALPLPKTTIEKIDKPLLLRR